MNELDKAFTQGFMTECSETGVDAEEVVKLSIDIGPNSETRTSKMKDQITAGESFRTVKTPGKLPNEHPESVTNETEQDLKAAYYAGFIDKCAMSGVDPELVVKQAAVPYDDRVTTAGGLSGGLLGGLGAGAGLRALGPELSDLAFYLKRDAAEMRAKLRWSLNPMLADDLARNSSIIKVLSGLKTRKGKLGVFAAGALGGAAIGRGLFKNRSKSKWERAKDSLLDTKQNLVSAVNSRM